MIKTNILYKFYINNKKYLLNTNILLIPIKLYIPKIFNTINLKFFFKILKNLRIIYKIKELSIYIYNLPILINVKNIYDLYFYLFNMDNIKSIQKKNINYIFFLKYINKKYKTISKK